MVGSLGASWSPGAFVVRFIWTAEPQRSDGIPRPIRRQKPASYASESWRDRGLPASTTVYPRRVITRPIPVFDRLTPSTDRWVFFVILCVFEASW